MQYIVTLEGMSYDIALYHLEQAAIQSIKSIKHQTSSTISSISVKHNAENIGTDVDPVIKYQDQNDGLTHSLYFPFLRSAENEVRKSFLVAAYHHWETAITSWALDKTPKDANLRSHDVIEKKARELGYPPDKDISILSFVSNAIKHNSSNSWKKLKDNAPSIFEEMKMVRRLEGILPSYTTISDDRLKWAFDIVKNSSPSKKYCPTSQKDAYTL